MQKIMAIVGIMPAMKKSFMVHWPYLNVIMLLLSTPSRNEALAFVGDDDGEHGGGHAMAGAHAPASGKMLMAMSAGPTGMMRCRSGMTTAVAAINAPQKRPACQRWS